MIPENILKAFSSLTWWGPWFARGDWNAWRAFLSAMFALPLDEDAMAIYRECTRRTELPTTVATEAWAICGRRSGKTRVMATVAAWLAAFVDWRDQLAPGETATVMIIAADRRQARNAFRYLRSLFLDHPNLAALVSRETDESLELVNRVVIEVATASFRTTRGYTVAAVLCDELAFWYDSESSSNPATEVLNALRASGATLQGSLLMVATTPYARRGAVWETYRRHWAKDNDSILVWKAPTRRMNPTVPQDVIDMAMEEDASAAAAEWLAEFRVDVETFVAREVVEAAVVAGRYELPPVSGIGYAAFVDPSGGSNDSMTLAIAHRGTDGKGVLDALRETRPPFSPESVVADFSDLLKTYGLRNIEGDRYAGEWPRERFREHGVEYQVAERTKSDIYRELLPLLNSNRLELLDHPRLVSQIVGLERRTARGGKDSIDHAPAGHDDIANAAAGVLVQVAGQMDVLEMWSKLGEGYNEFGTSGFYS